MAIVKDLGMVTAYAYAVAGGYEGTEAEFTELLGQAGITLEQLENLTAVATTLSEGSEATASYSGGVLTFGIPRGNTGATGPQGPQGAQGDTGNGIASISKTGTSGLVDTYTITFTDGTTTTFTVTNGADGDITNVAQAFDATKAYSVGDMVLYQGTLYAFTAAHPAGAWAGSDAQAVILADEVTSLKSDLSEITGNVLYSYTKDKSVSNTAIPTQASEANWESVVVECNEGDEFVVKGYGGILSRLWMFGKSDGTLISQSVSALHTNDFVHIVAPPLTKYLCVNSMYAQIKGQLIGGELLKDTLAKLNDLTTISETTASINVEAKYMSISGSLENGYYHASFEVVKGESYKIKAQTGSSIRTYVLISNGTVIDYATDDAWGTEHNYDVVYNVPQDGTLYVNSIVNTYIGAKKVSLELINQPTVDSLENTKTAVDNIAIYKTSPNLFNGEYLMGYRASKTVTESDTYCYTKPIALHAGTYLFTSAVATFGGGGQCAYITTADGTVLQNADVITGTSVGNKNEFDKWNNREILKFTLSDDAYVSFNVGRPTATTYGDQVNNFMLTEGTTLADIPHYEKYFAPLYAVNEDFVNGLSGLYWKTAIFDGDSICRGDSVGASDPSYYDGYAGRIGKANYMTWKNYGIGGGCITSASNPSVGSSKHSVVDNVDTLYAQFPDADFIIFEGGTNDADLLGDAIADPTKLGSYTDNDYSGTYDITTFSGALETIFYKAIQYWKGKKIGFVVAQKMGAGYSKFDKDHANRRAYFERAIEICNKWGVPCLNLWDGCYLNPRNASCYNPDLDADGNRAQGYLYIDGQHLTAKGYDYIAPIIEDWMKSL